MEFSEEEFAKALTSYHNSVWPIPAIQFILGAALIALVLFQWKHQRRLILGGLALLWLWCGTIFMTYYISGLIPHTTFAPQAVLFSVQGILFILAMTRDAEILDFRFEVKPSVIIGTVIAWFALIGAPVIGTLTGKFYPAAPAFGDPCPLTIFTFGILLCSVAKVPWYFIIIPFLWSLTGLIGVVQLGIYDDFIEFLVGIGASAWILYKNSQIQAPVPATN